MIRCPVCNKPALGVEGDPFDRPAAARCLRLECKCEAGHLWIEAGWFDLKGADWGHYSVTGETK